MSALLPEDFERLSPVAPKNGNGVRVSFQVLAWVISMILGGAVVYAVTEARIAVLEEQMHQLRTDVTEIKSDVKGLLRR